MTAIVTCIAPVNIAVVKYWGKRDEELILPLNDSVSVTLGTNEMHSKTTVMASPEFKNDQIWLNGVKESIKNPRLSTCLSEIRSRKKKQCKGTEGESMADWKVHICSENNFPTAAGLASSASGYACLVFALSKLFGLEGDVSSIARMGSGSACRSLSGGFVRWKAGSAKDGADSLAQQVAPASHWPNIRILILVVNAGRKKIGSTDGMQRSVKTSELLKYRVEHCVPQRTKTIIKAILERDFGTFADVTMKDSNQLHSVCLDTFPPNVYMNDVSHSIVEFVHTFNKVKGATRLCYTFDAGPNACLFVEDRDVNEVISLLCESFPPCPESKENYVRGMSYDIVSPKLEVEFKQGPQEPGLLNYIIHTKVGSGPKLLNDPSQHLLDIDNGLPKKHSVS